jgi:hypothetical protein
MEMLIAIQLMRTDAIREVEVCIGNLAWDSRLDGSVA